MSTIIIVMVFCFSLLFSSFGHAQQRLDKPRLAAVLSVINSYLLYDVIEDPEYIEIDFNKIDSRSYSINENFEITFPQENRTIEFCFVLTSRANLQLEINGVSQSLTSGENCFTLSTAQQSAINSIQFSYTNGGGSASISLISFASANPSISTLASLTRRQWNESAVRKVLKIFAFGGHARDSQIRLWANMRPYDAIRQMLNFDEHNLRLSPLAINERYRQTASNYGKLLDFVEFVSDTASDLPIPPENREQFGVDMYNFDAGFIRMVTTRGLNPFRQKIGFWETNYHLAVNLDTAVSQQQLAKYYDLIMEAHEANQPYYQVMGIAAKSAAIAMQYGHYQNQWVYDEETQEFVCRCNEDFAREVHQLFYGIFGEGDDNHETVTIPETAKMLTGMPVEYIPYFGFALDVDFQLGLRNTYEGDPTHHLNPVTIFGQQISGADAEKKIDALMPISMQHAESEKNLPVMIISVLADDNLSDEKADQLRAAWLRLGPNRRLLDFIRAYAISFLFHDNQQHKYFTSHERALYLANKSNLDNLESYYGGEFTYGKQVDLIIERDFAGSIFRPIHNVFGGQTSEEARGSSLAFEKNYNLLWDSYNYLFSVACDNCDQGQSWQKPWQHVLPTRADGDYYVADVAQWLWKHVVGNLDNFTELERAHLYTILGSGREREPGESYDQELFMDFSFLMCMVDDYRLKNGSSAVVTLDDLLSDSGWNHYCAIWDDNNGNQYTQTELASLNRVYTGLEISESPTIQDLLTELGDKKLELINATGSNDGKDIGRYTRERINAALQFIFSTPFVFVEAKQ